MVNTDSPTTQPAGFSAVHDGRVLRVTLTKPKRKNALDYDSLVAEWSVHPRLAELVGDRLA